MHGPTQLTCREVFDRLADYLDRELTPEEVEHVEAHLALCEMCAREYRFEATVLDCLKQKLRRISAPPDLLAKVRRTIEEAGGR